MTMKEIIQALGDAKDATLELRDNANHDEYAKYGELYEAILEAEKIAMRNFAKRQKWEVRWIDAWMDEDRFWQYNETREVGEVATDEDEIEQAKDAMLRLLRENEIDALSIAAGVYRWNVVDNCDPVTIELVERKSDKPLYCATPIN